MFLLLLYVMVQLKVVQSGESWLELSKFTLFKSENCTQNDFIAFQYMQMNVMSLSMKCSLQNPSIMALVQVYFIRFKFF